MCILIAYLTWRKSCSGDAEECADQIVRESAQSACDFAYLSTAGSWIKSDDVLRRDYYDTRYLVIEQRLIAGGVRLAALINRVAASFKDTEDRVIILTT